jgi:hypothetical protein
MQKRILVDVGEVWLTKAGELGVLRLMIKYNPHLRTLGIARSQRHSLLIDNTVSKRLYCNYGNVVYSVESVIFGSSLPH